MCKTHHGSEFFLLTHIYLVVRKEKGKHCSLAYPLTPPPPFIPSLFLPTLQWTLEGAAGTPTNPLLLSSLLIEKGLALQSRDNMSAVIIALPAVPVVSPAVVEAYEAHRAATRTAENSGHGGSGVAGA